MQVEEKRHSAFVQWIRRLGWTLLGLVMLGVLLRLSLKTDFVRNWAKGLIVSTANEQLNGTLTIDAINGDLWKEFTISGIQISQQDTVVSVDSVHVAYNIWALVNGQVDIYKLGIYQPYANLKQQGNLWNVQDLMKKSSDTTSSGSMFGLHIEDLNLENGVISVEADSLPVESNFTIKQLEIGSRLSFSDARYDINLRDLSFDVTNTKLDQPLRVKTAASANSNKITLEKLVLATGNSLVKSSASFSRVDSAAHLNVSAVPISWKDIASYANSLPLRQNLKVNLDINGKPSQFGLQLKAQADGLESFKIGSRFQWKQSLVLQQITASAEYINPGTFLADTTLPSLHNLNAEFSGNVNLQDYQKGSGSLQFSAHDIQQTTHHIDKISVQGNWSGPSATVDLEANQQQQNVNTHLEASQVWSDLPRISAKLKASHIDPGVWTQDTTYSGDVNFTARASGAGWYPDKQAWDYSIDLSQSHLMNQPISSLSASGKLSHVRATLDGQMKIRGGVLTFNANVQDLQANPTYKYKITSRDFDPAALTGIKDFATSLNGRITGSGRGFDPTKMQLHSSVEIDSSIVNGEYIRGLSADIAIRDTVAVVDSARLRSTIADGEFNFRMHMLHRYDSNNQLSLKLHLKDISALAPLAAIDTLAAEGNVTGKLSPDGEENLTFNGSLDLSGVKYNSLFTSDNIKGSVEARIHNNFEYKADVDLEAPTFSGLRIQDMHFKTSGDYIEPRTAGQFEFQFSSPNEGRIEQAGRYSIKGDSIRVITDTLNIVSDFRTLRLQKSFTLNIAGNTIRMDTMRVTSQDQSAFLEIGIPIINENEQRGFVRGQSLNTAVIQSCLLGESYFKGMLSGQFQIARKDTSLQARGNLLLSDIDYQGAQFDSLVVGGNINNDRMQGDLTVRNEGQQLVHGEADLPFKLGDPQNFPNAFFAESVSGQFDIKKIDIEQFRPIFNKAGITNTKGVFSFHGHLHGQAGMPQFSGDAVLHNAVLSGVPVDSVTAGLDYNHEESELHLNASVISLQQKAAQIDAQIPLFINMRTFRVDLPGEQDSIAVDVSTHNFNLAALNDFVDRQLVRNVSGELNGSVQLRGQVNDLKTDGQLVLHKGAFRLVPAGIRVDNMQSTLNFKPDKIELSHFSAGSGKGSMKASGIIAMKQLIPGDINVDVSANNFRVANTAHYNAVIDLDAKAGGTFTQPKISGKLNVISGFLELQNFGEKSVENVQLDSAETGPNVSVYDSLSLDLDLAFNRRFYIRNKKYLDMQMELDGSVDMLKDPGKDLQIFGAINTADGYARPFGKEFKLQEGQVTFSGDPTNPKLRVRTRYEPPQTQQDIVIWYTIEGTVENPKFKYESEPPMELENIISYTLFGQPFYALDSWKQVVANSGGNTSAASVALDVLLDRVETLATQKLGIDVVKIDNNRSNGENGTSITTGWYLNPKVFFAIQNVITGSTPDTSFELEYMLQKNLKIIIRQGNGIRQGVDLKWNYDY